MSQPLSDLQLNSPSPSNTNKPLRIYVEHAVRQYFAELEGEQPHDLYELVLQEVEKPLLAVVLENTRGNQSKTAQILGLNRGTLRKKMQNYGLI
ncbi:DNA-binding transcriptional regulator Fis [Psychrobacter sp. I-STPA10]|uniref:DNA-binding transcriptional regulator Fis n=1 Tax=Psychrobacter sp. I-STPA10 TaxID=2585769 RepID=UPI001E495250|nr:DNA-binding transcriptional regulator Fis [Psychrobacter sp. I-STPA10]